MTCSKIQAHKKMSQTDTDVPPSQPQFPLPYINDFEDSVPPSQPRYMCQMLGAWEVAVDIDNKSNVVLSQKTLQQPLDRW